MNIGIDIDDVITDHPDHYKSLMEDWIISGFKVYLITGNKNGDMSRAARLRQLKLLGFTPNYYTELCIASGLSDNLIAHRKSIIAYQKQLDIFIDNDEHNCSEVRRRLPNCLVLRDM